MMNKYEIEIREIDMMIRTLEEQLKKWKELQVRDYKYTINRFESLITALKIHRNMSESQLECFLNED